MDRGARRLDCDDIEHHLPKLYGAHGFKEIARAKFDWNEADPDWDYEHLHEPDVIAMAITKEQPAEVPYVKYPGALAMAKEASENL